MQKQTADVVNAFVEPCLSILEELAPKTAPIHLGDPRMEALKVSDCEVNLISMVSGDLEAKVVFGLSTDMAMEVAEQMMNIQVDSLDSVAQSAITELVNIIIGKTSMALAELAYETTVSPVSFSYGNLEPIGTTECPHPVTIPLITALGTLELDLAFY